MSKIGRKQVRHLIRLACDIEPETLVDVLPERISEAVELVWNRESERVDAFAVVRYDNIVIDRSEAKRGAGECGCSPCRASNGCRPSQVRRCR